MESAKAQRRPLGKVGQAHRAVGGHHGGGQVARSGQGAAPGGGVVDRVEAGRADDLLALRASVGRLLLIRQAVDQVIQVGEDLVRGVVEVGQGVHGRAQAAHGGRRVQTMADHIADDEGDAGSGEGDDIEPVAADAGGGIGRQIAVRDLDRAVLGQLPRQQAALQGQRSLVLLGVAAGVVDAQGGARGEFFREREVVLLERFGPLRPPQAEQAEEQTAGRQRYDDQ